MLSEPYDVFRELENQERSALCEREGYQFHARCDERLCECPCHEDNK